MLDTTPVSAALKAYQPERVWQARHAFFERGEAPVGMVSDAVLRSWQRCLQMGRSAHETVEFELVERGALRHLLQAHELLLTVAEPEVQALSRLIADAGYAVLLTDAQGRALAVNGALERLGPVVRQAFRPGVNLSEAMIGTSAMAAAVAKMAVLKISRGWTSKVSKVPWARRSTRMSLRRVFSRTICRFSTL